LSKPLLKHSRLPRKYELQQKLTAEIEQKPMPSVADGLRGQDPRKILLRYLSDESTEVIAKDYGVTRQSLGQYLLKHAEEEWKGAQVARALARKEKAEDDMANAADPLQLAKARELLKSAQWDLERVCKRIYGIDHNLNLNVSIGDLGDRLRRARERVIDVTPEAA
jgi:hypothetical protein